MEINSPSMRVLSDAVSTKFKFWLDSAPSQYRDIATEIPSAGRGNFYPRLDEIPGMREWLGPRVVHELSTTAYYIKNRTFEETIGIDRDDIEDDQFGIFNLAMGQLGKNAGELPDVLTFGMLKLGATTKCYDGQNFFDQDHLNYDAAGNPLQYSNYDVGTGPSWYLLDNSQLLRALIYQPRRAPALTAKTKLDDDNVFEARRFLWGVDMRCAAGFGLWQVAYRSDLPLTADNYAHARAAMGGLRRLDGKPYGLRPQILLVPPALEGPANALAKNELVSTVSANGTSFVAASNQWRGTITPMVCPWLA